jgi:type III pantothenate kinase
MVSRFKMEMGAPDANVIGTGGLITSIIPHTGVINIVEPWLTLIGLREIYRLNTE